MQASGFQLAQEVATNTSASELFSASMITEITNILVANTSGSATTFSLYHDDDGSTYDQTTALFYQVDIDPNSTFSLMAETLNAGIVITAGGTIGFQAGTGNALTFTAYGVTQRTSQ